MERACHDAKGQNLVDPTSKSVQTTVLASIFILCSFLDCITIPPGNSVWRLPRLQPAAVPIADTMFGTFDAERNKRWTVHNAQEFNYYCGEPPLSPETFKWLVTSFGGQQMQPQHKVKYADWPLGIAQVNCVASRCRTPSHWERFTGTWLGTVCGILSPAQIW